MPPEPKPPATSTTGQPSWMAPVKPVVPDHELVRPIGGGSYGDVWLARTTVGTWRAVKVVFRDRFTDARPYEREFNGIQKFEPLSRSNEAFIDILQIGRNDAEGYFYYVMELADDANSERSDGVLEQGSDGKRGPRQPSTTPSLQHSTFYIPKTLAKVLLQRGRLPVSECLELGLTLNLGLAHLHKAGLIHRDIKPSNIIFVGGVPKLADIGLVIETVEARSFVGTEGFIPPEGPNSPQADLYSLGKVLYEAGMGKDRKDFPEPYTQIAETPDAAQLLEFNAILLKACAANREERYQTAEEMNADLALLQSGGSVRRQRKLAGQLRFVQRAGAVVTALAGVIALGWWWQARETKMVRQLVQQKEQQRKLARDNLYFADIRVAYNEWESGQIAKTLELLRRHIPQGAEPDRRGWEWYYLLSLCHRDERTLQAHAGWVWAVRCDPAGRRFASGGEDHFIRIWDAESGACVGELKGHTGRGTYCVAWSPDGTRLASGGLDGKVILWDAERFQKLFERDGYGQVWAIAWSPDGKRFAVGGADHARENTNGLVTIWDANSGERLHYLKGGVDQIWSLAWHPGGKLLAAGANTTGRIQIWDPDSGQLLRTIHAHNKEVNAVAWKPDGRQLASASDDQRVRIWDAETWKPITTIDPAHSGRVEALAWSEDGQRLVSGGHDGLIKIWDAQTGQQLNALRGHQGTVRSIAWWPGHGRILSGGNDGTLRIWNPDIEQVARTVAGEGACAWSPDGRRLAVGSPRGDTNGGVIQILDVATWRTLFTLPGVRSHFPRSLAWNPDSRLLAAGFLSGQVQVWDLATRREILFLPKAHGVKGVRAVAWSPDGRLLATAGNDGAVRLWNVEAKENLLTFLEHSNWVSSAVWSPDGQWIASKDDAAHVMIWAAQTGKVKLKLQYHGANIGRQYDVSWSPQGDKLAAGSGYGTVMVWDAKTGRLLHTLKGHSSQLRSVQWSPDGRRLVSGAEDRTIRIWDPQSGRELLELADPQNMFPSVAWSPDGRMISVAGSSAVVYDATLGYKLAPQLAQSPANR